MTLILGREPHDHSRGDYTRTNMISRTISKLQYFVGRICTVFTGPINRDFDEVRSREHFVVKVREIDIDGLWGTHPYNDTVSFFPLSEIKLITEETVLDPNNPEHARMIQQYQDKTGETIVSDVSPHLAPTVSPPLQSVDTDDTGLGNLQPESAFVDIKHLTALAKQTKINLSQSVRSPGF